ncbi:hypothetical protein [Acidobacterium sp. S8]|uniref:hypothetical protein n=1 Tax=Acidobacterium sp. S8 TaxID=1641854 RepID=UPI00131EA929|nr:hypothetical protein [Acidobacterium sp. S8]
MSNHSHIALVRCHTIHPSVWNHTGMPCGGAYSRYVAILIPMETAALYDLNRAAYRK